MSIPSPIQVCQAVVIEDGRQPSSEIRKHWVLQDLTKATVLECIDAVQFAQDAGLVRHEPDGTPFLTEAGARLLSTSGPVECSVATISLRTEQP